MDFVTLHVITHFSATKLVCAQYRKAEEESNHKGKQIGNDPYAHPKEITGFSIFPHLCTWPHPAS